MQGSGMSTKFTYALILSVCGALFNLLMYFTGFQTEKLATGQYFQWLGIVMMFVVLWLGIKAVRDEAPAKGMSYGRAVGTGTLIALFSGLISAGYSFVHFKFVNTEFADFQIAMLRTQWEARGLAEAQMEQAEKFTRAMMGPVAQAILTPIFVTLFGLVCSLIIAAFLKRPASDETTSA
jgi:high-affinity Fe2+/Pb2+ permease